MPIHLPAIPPLMDGVASLFPVAVAWVTVAMLETLSITRVMLPALPILLAQIKFYREILQEPVD